ncbi:lactate utilization protein [Clostridium estertheticum]|uniref:lactate utilization protein n=1 Tax=Clostridium estertheticum TaxID=238834 RepID=UPI001CF10656|nr:lactate utilization protein [Clostridium estertheticum]MCB2306503.1 lactate utilization protein [Clostridium estertheticum]MCB2345091.1 lactate utilization protein [Clostridium estertheticum]MCB2350135.1 lactate utilization protein [Clostridium estertheticum]WAG44272.1 lactate utilization protein [Clostridium estertheticum]
MKEIYNLHNETIGLKVVENLKRNDFSAIYFKTGVEASKFIMENIRKGDKVGFGGSMTVVKLGIQEKVASLGGVVLDHGDPTLSPDDKMETMRGELLSDVFICSSNAVTMDGELVNIDGVGNRIAAMTFGPKKVIVVVGVNKICKNESSAFERLEQIAAPMNNMRLKIPNPCTKTGVCMDCKVASRICRVYSVIKRRPVRTDMTVILIGDELGY